MNEFKKDAEDLAKDLAKSDEGKLDSAGQNALSALNQWRHHRDRSLIVQCVIWLYVSATGLLIVVLLYRGVWHGDDKAFSNLFDLLKVAVLPVVTLVIGYYFGTSKSE